jgi:two-component system, chemotaxis family, CheB/CheR fusion protein
VVASLEPAFEFLLTFLKNERGFDFTGYKRASLERRVRHRMDAVQVHSFEEYHDYLQVHPEEFTALFNTILINVTSFFRDAPAWGFLASDVIPGLLEEMTDGQSIRVWSAGCASGQEAYTAAMVLAEAIGADAFKARVKIYATDLDDDALVEARQGIYPTAGLKDVPAEMVEKYFEPSSRGMAFRPDLRRSIIFGRNDLMSDAPISRIDLLICRNVLMYFTPEAQGHILERFNFALNPTGYLFLGKSEMLVSHSELFSPHEVKWRIFRKVRRDNLRERLGFLAPDPFQENAEAVPGLQAGAAALSPVAQIVVDRGGRLVEVNKRARETFGLGDADIGRPFQDAPLSYRPADLRSAIDRVYTDNRSVQLEDVQWIDLNGGPRVLQIEIIPVLGADEALGATLSFTDVTALSKLSADYELSRRELETAYEELQSTVEELETTNEELQSTNEELETTNEELQSTNEELETMNEELQSTNDELETMNTEVTTRATELDRLNLFFEGILGALRVGVVVIDRDHKVQIWNAMSNDLWGLRADEVEDTDFMSLDIGLPVKQLEDAIARAFGGSSNAIEERVEAINRRGKQFECVVRVIPLQTRSGDIYASMILTASAGDG